MNSELERNHLVKRMKKCIKTVKPSKDMGRTEKAKNQASCSQGIVESLGERDRDLVRCMSNESPLRAYVISE